MPTPNTPHKDKSKHPPLSPFVRSAVLGMMLGDAGLFWKNTEHPALYMNHGGKQHEYNLHKASLLEGYYSTPPRLTDNPGWGDHWSRFSTVTSPAFDFLKSLCTDGVKKLVTCTQIACAKTECKREKHRLNSRASRARMKSKS